MSLKNFEVARKAALAARSCLHEATKDGEEGQRAVARLRVDQVSELIHALSRDVAFIRDQERKS